VTILLHRGRDLGQGRGFLSLLPWFMRRLEVKTLLILCLKLTILPSLETKDQGEEDGQVKLFIVRLAR
jgi:hypothetical protein